MMTQLLWHMWVAWTIAPQTSYVHPAHSRRHARHSFFHSFRNIDIKKPAVITDHIGRRVNATFTIEGDRIKVETDEPWFDPKTFYELVESKYLAR